MPISDVERAHLTDVLREVGLLTTSDTQQPAAALV
jgi:hypothetical protein